VKTSSREPRSSLLTRAIRLERLTTAWNIVEGTGAIVAGIAAHSVALTAFGLDSAVEVFASSVAAWQLREESARQTRVALRLIAGSFIVVAVYIGYQAWVHVRHHREAAASPVGIALTALAAVMMSVLAFKKRALGRELENQVLIAEARFSFVDAGLSSAVLLGLVLNAALGWWWADPAAAFLLAAYSLKEGVEGLRRRVPVDT
jgi:divalent metal cation (Fe/Co/Zn/Cd) transporter